MHENKHEVVNIMKIAKDVKKSRGTFQDFIDELNSKVGELEGCTVLVTSSTAVNKRGYVDDSNMKVAESICNKLILPDGYSWRIEDSEDKYGVPIIEFQILKDGKEEDVFSWGLGMDPDDKDFDDLAEVPLSGQERRISKEIKDFFPEYFTSSVTSSKKKQLTANEKDIYTILRATLKKNLATKLTESYLM